MRRPDEPHELVRLQLEIAKRQLAEATTKIAEMDAAGRQVASAADYHSKRAAELNLAVILLLYSTHGQARVEFPPGTLKAAMLDFRPVAIVRLEKRPDGITLVAELTEITDKPKDAEEAKTDDELKRN